MSLLLNTNGTQTGTTPIEFKSIGGSPQNQKVLAAPTDTRLQPRQIKFISNTPTTNASNPGNARSTVRFILGSRVENGDCCSVKAGTVTVDLIVNWPLSQPVELVDELVGWLQGLAYSQDLKDLIVSGHLPE